jgi:hypothetical protein
VTPGNVGVIVLKSVVAVAGVGLAAYLLIELRSLIVPVAVAGLLAYVCRPLVAMLERYRVHRDVAIGMLLLLFVLSALFIVNRIRAVMPTDLQAVELKVEVLHKINERYKALMGLDESLANGDRLYRIVHRDLDPLINRVNQELALTPEERATLFASRPRRPDAATTSDRLPDHDRANLLTLKLRSRTALTEVNEVGFGRPEVQAPMLVPKKPLTALADILSTWLVAPLVFLFLLRDTGELKRGLLGMISNRLFEPALTVKVSNLTLTECTAYPRRFSRSPPMHPDLHSSFPVHSSGVRRAVVHPLPPGVGGRRSRVLRGRVRAYDNRVQGLPEFGYKPLTQWKKKQNGYRFSSVTV